MPRGKVRRLRRSPSASRAERLAGKPTPSKTFWTRTTSPTSTSTTTGKREMYIRNTGTVGKFGALLKASLSARDFDVFRTLLPPDYICRLYTVIRDKVDKARRVRTEREGGRGTGLLAARLNLKVPLLSDKILIGHVRAPRGRRDAILFEYSCAVRLPRETNGLFIF